MSMPRWTLADIVNNKAKVDEHFVHDCVEDAVMVKALKDQEELEEIRKRTIVIIHGLVEATEPNLDVRQQQDINELQNLLEVKCSDVSVTGTVRLGKKNESDDGKLPASLINVNHVHFNGINYTRCFDTLFRH